MTEAINYTETQRPDGLVQITFSHPAFDRRHDDPSKNYGVGSVRRFFVLKGPEGATAWDYSTGEYLPHVIEWWRERGLCIEDCTKTHGGPLVYHSPKPIYEGQEPGSCGWVDGGQCCSDAGFCAGAELTPLYEVCGEKYVWQELHSIYRYRFLREND